MNATISSIEKQAPAIEALGSHRPKDAERVRLRVVIAIAVLAVLSALSAYAVFHSSGVVIDLP
jgi:hypothetical protein